MIAASNILAGLFLPESGPSQNANDIAELYLLIMIMALVVFAGVEGILIWILFRFRARRGRVAAQIHGNTRLEIGWTVGAAVILVFLTIATFVMLPGIKNPAPSDIDENGTPVAANAAFATTDQPRVPGGHSMNIEVNGKQYVWQFTYPGDDKVFSYTRMYVPVGMTITLDIRSDDVQHSWWIPELGGKADALPGYTNKTWFKVTEEGVYKGQCAELCGRNHANMLAEVVALPFDEWQDWYDTEAQEIKDAEEFAAQQREQMQGSEGDDSSSTESDTESE